MTRSRPVVRLADIADAGPIASVNVTAWREAYGHGLMPQEIMQALSIERSRQRWIAALRATDPDGRTFVTDIDGRTVGYVSCGRQRPERPVDGHDGEIFAIYVLAAFHRRGVASALLHGAADNLARQGLRSAMVWTLRDNMAARAFYEATGAHVVASGEDRRGDHVLEEIAYGWPDLSILAGRH